MRFLTSLALLLLVCFVDCALGQVPTSVEGVFVTSSSEITRTERELLHRLKGKLIPLPDTIRFRRQEGTGAWQGGTITLSPGRHQPPWRSNRSMPYLYGRSSAALSNGFQPKEVYTLAHEIAHWMQWQMWNGRPRLPGVLWWETEAAARGPFAIRRETEADLMAAAILQITLNIPLQTLGFPERTWAGKTDSLVRDYRGRIGDAYRFSVGPSPLPKPSSQKPTE